MKKILSIAALSLCILLLSGCQCKHEWVEADCYTPKTCSKCKITEGEPRQHIPGEWIDLKDVPYDRTYREQFCAECGLLLQSEGQLRDSYISNNKFEFSPNDFLERFEKLAKEYYPDFSYEVVKQDSGAGVSLYLDGATDQGYVLVFTDMSAQARTVEKYDAAGIYMVVLGKTGKYTAPNDVLIDGNLVHTFCRTCDPSFSEDDWAYLGLEYTLSHLEWTEGNSNLFSAKLNGVNYGFLYGYLERDNFFVHQISVNPD